MPGVAIEAPGQVGEAGLPHNLALCLFHLKVLIAQRTSGVTTIVNGVVAYEDGRVTPAIAGQRLDCGGAER